MVMPKPELERLGYFRWRCRRGMKELDYVLNGFLDKCWIKMTDTDKLLLDGLLEEEDMLLWYWFSGKEQPQNTQIKSLVERICAAGYHKKS